MNEQQAALWIRDRFHANYREEREHKRAGRRPDYAYVKERLVLRIAYRKLTGQGLRKQTGWWRQDFECI